MIEAVVRRKLGSSQSRVHERSEDLLTSTAFGLLRYLPCDQGIMALLHRTRRAYREGGELVVESDDVRNIEWLGLQTAVRCEFEFWPWWGQHGQPDILLRLFDDIGSCVHLIVIEVKLDASKSGSAQENDVESVDDEPDPDQLAKYWQGINAICPVVMSDYKTVIYLTSHVIPPIDELDAALRRKPKMRLGWLSWRQLSRVVEHLRQSAFNSLPAADLARLLEYYGFKDFQGMRSKPSPWPCNGHFWKSDNWFANLLRFNAITYKPFWRAR